MIKAYGFKLEPNGKQKYALARTLDVCRELYNDCLYPVSYTHLDVYKRQGSTCEYTFL